MANNSPSLIPPNPQGFNISDAPPPPPGFVPDTSAQSQVPVDDVNAGMPDDQAAIPPPPEGFVPEEQVYGTTGQRVLAGLEGAAKGVAGALAPATEEAFGVNPEDIKARQRVNPWTHGLSEAGSFVGSMLTGTGEAALLGKAGEAALEATNLAHLGQEATVGSKLLAGATRAATEMGLMGANDAATKAILNEPQSVGDVAAQVGMSALLGAATGPLFSATGMLGEKLLQNQVASDFAERLAFKKAHIDPAEMMKYEADKSINTFENMNNELWGPANIKSKGVENLIPEINNKMMDSTNELASKIQGNLDEMASNPDNYPTRLVNLYSNAVNPFLETVTKPGVSSQEIFESVNDLKNWAQDLSKKMWKYGPLDPESGVAEKILDLSKNLRPYLEDTSVWGDAAHLQKDLNKAFSTAKPYFDDFKKKFMVKEGNDYVISNDKFQSYINKVSKATTQSDRQQLLGKFIDAADNYYRTVQDIYEKAGVPSPHTIPSMTALKESVKVPSLGARLADLWEDKIGPYAIGRSAGAGLGAAAGAHFGPVGGLAGAYLGEEILGPAFSSVIKPLMDKFPTVNPESFKAAYSYAQAVVKGDALLNKAVKGVFMSGGNAVINSVMPSKTELARLDKLVQQNSNNVNNLVKPGDHIADYLPNHASNLTATVSNAVNVAATLKPMKQSGMLFDPKREPSVAEKAAYERQLSIIQQPMAILKHVKDGTLNIQDVNTLKSVYPEYYNKMAAQVMQELSNHKELPFKVQQSLSLFLGSPLSLIFTPQGIMAAQPQQAPPLPAQPKIQGSNKGSLKNIGKIGQNYSTPLQVMEQHKAQKA